MRGLILTGGKSRRMGSDKAELVYHSLPQWRHAGDLLASCCEGVFWSCTTLQKERWKLGENGIVDRVPDEGPAGGLAAAFSLEPRGPWLVLACDFPYVTEGDLLALVRARSPAHDAVAYANPEDGLPEPFLAVWETPAQERLLSAVHRGNTSPRAVLRAGNPLVVYAREPNSLINLNCRAV